MMINSSVLIDKLNVLKDNREHAAISDEDVEIVEKKVAEYKAKLMDELNANVEQEKALLDSQISLLEELLKEDDGITEKEPVNTSPQYL